MPFEENHRGKSDIAEIPSHSPIIFPVGVELHYKNRLQEAHPMAVVEVVHLSRVVVVEVLH